MKLPSVKSQFCYFNHIEQIYQSSELHINYDSSIGQEIFPKELNCFGISKPIQYKLIPYNSIQINDTIYHISNMVLESYLYS